MPYFSLKHPHLKKFSLLIVPIIAITAASWWYHPHLSRLSSEILMKEGLSSLASDQGGCPSHHTYVTRVMGGWKETPASDPTGLCIDNETLKTNLVKDPSWTDRILSFLSLKNEASAAGNTYYVATNGVDAPGCRSQSNPCRHIYYTARQMQSGDTMAILPGTYADHLYSDSGVDFTNNSGPGLPSGTASQPTTIKAANGPGTVVIQPDKTPEVGWGFGLDEMSYVVVDGLTFDGASFNFGDADKKGRRSDHITLQNSVLKNAPIVALNGIGDYVEIINNKMYDNGRDEAAAKANCCPWPGYAVYECGDNQLWQGNEFYNNGGYALHFNGAGARCLTNSVITNNILHDNSIGFFTKPLPRSSDGQGGIILNNGENVLIYNNVFYNNNGSCIRIAAGSGNKIYNNTCYDDIAGAAVIDNFVYASNNVIQNNIAWSLVNENNNPVTQNNNLWTQQTNPQFVNPSTNDFHLQSTSPAINTGMTLPSVPCDFDGKARPSGGAYDIGAYEYGSSPGGSCGGTPATPTPTPSGSSCTQYTSSTPLSSIPSGFGVPWDVTNPSVMLVSAQCSPPTVVLKAGNPNTTSIMYVYKTAYTAASGATSWTPVDLFGSQLISGSWYPSSAQGVAQIQNLTQSTWYVAYTCTWNGTQWKCGCRDQACTQSYWQLQRIQQ